MSLLRARLARVVTVAALALVPAAGVLVPSDASASVSIAVAFDTLVKDADQVALVTPGDAQSVWEEGRIYTYTRVRFDQGVAGELGAGAEGFVRTMGGVVGKIGQMVDGEPVFVKDKASLLFLRKLKAGNVFEVSARAQGQYPLTVDAVTKKPKLMRSTAVGMLLPPKPPVEAAPVSGAAQTSSVRSDAAKSSRVDPQTLRLAQEVLHERTLEDSTREIATTWKRLHPIPAAAK